MSFGARLRIFRTRLRTKYGQLSDITLGIIEDREKRGVIVVDASVAVKWFIEEHGTAAAEALLSGSRS